MRTDLSRPDLSRREFVARLAPVAATAAVAPMPAFAAPLPTAEDRARFHYAELAKALDELAIGVDGWMLQAGRHDAVNSSPAGRWATVSLVHYEPDDEPGYGRLMIERHERCVVRLV